MSLAPVYTGLEVISTTERQPDWVVLFFIPSKGIAYVFGPLYRRALFNTYLTVYQYIFVHAKVHFVVFSVFRCPRAFDLRRMNGETAQLRS